VQANVEKCNNLKHASMQEQSKDKQLDLPSVANEDKHINSLTKEEKESRDAEIVAGKEELKEEPPFQKRDLNEEEEY
jgi:hypothetical protein